MGIRINKNAQGLYSLYSTDSNERLHEEECLDDKGVKKYLISRKLWEFIEEIIRIYGDFPNGFFINGLMKTGDLNGTRFVSMVLEKDNCDEIMFTELNSIIEKLNLDFKIVANVEPEKLELQPI